MGIESHIFLLSPSHSDGATPYPVIKTEFLEPNIYLDGFDYLIFTSKNAVYALNKITHRWKEFPSFVTGEVVAKTVTDLGGRVVFQANGYGGNIVEEIKTNYCYSSFLFIRGQESAVDICTLLKKETIFVKEIIIYKTSCTNIKKELPNNSIIIFTSPSTVKCFFNNHKWKESYKAIAIGTTTKEALPKNIEVFMPQIRNIESCVSLAKDLEQSFS